MDPQPPLPGLEFMARFTVDLAPAWELGRTSGLGDRRIFPITGGRFDGPLLSGTILNNGADWQVVTPDGVAIVDTRYLLRLDDGSLVYLQTRGFRHGPPEVLAAIAAGDRRPEQLLLRGLHDLRDVLAQPWVAEPVDGHRIRDPAGERGDLRRLPDQLISP